MSPATLRGSRVTMPSASDPEGASMISTAPGPPGLHASTRSPCDLRRRSDSAFSGTRAASRSVMDASCGLHMTRNFTGCSVQSISRGASRASLTERFDDDMYALMETVNSVVDTPLFEAS